MDLAQRAEVMGDEVEFERLIREAEAELQQVLEIDSENVTAHANLAEVYAWIGETQKQQHHRRLHQRYKPDDTAAEVAQPAARRKYPAANHAAEALVIYDLHR